MQYSIDDLMILVDELTPDDPITHSQEGLDDACFFCGSWSVFNRNVLHEKDCPWITARKFMGKSLGTHGVKGE